MALAVRGKIKKIFILGVLSLVLLSGCGANEKKYFESGKALLEEGKYAQAVEVFDKAIGVHGSKNIRGLEIDILRYRAEAEYKAGD